MLLYASKTQMKDWEEICKKYAEVIGAKIIFINNTSCGIEQNGNFSHIYIDEMDELIKTINKTERRDK